jgi:hypothetical protein
MFYFGNTNLSVSLKSKAGQAGIPAARLTCFIKLAGRSS